MIGTMRFRVDPISQAYEETKCILYDQIHRFRAKYQGCQVHLASGTQQLTTNWSSDDPQWEELLSLVHELWMDAWHTFDPTKSTFPVWVRFSAYTGLRESLRLSKKRGQGANHCEVDNSVSEKEEGFNVTKFLSELSDDAVTAIKLMFSPNVDVFLNLRSYDEDAKKLVGASVFEYLRDLGWGIEKRKAVAREIKQAL